MNGSNLTKRAAREGHLRGLQPWQHRRRRRRDGPEIEWHEAEHSPWHVPGGHHGPTAVVTNVFARIPETLDHFEVEPRRFHDAGATVIVEARYRGDAPSTSGSLDAQACHVWTLRDGKLAAFQQCTDTWLFAQVDVDQPAPIRGE